MCAEPVEHGSDAVEESLDMPPEGRSDSGSDSDSGQGLPQDTGVATTSKPLPPVCRKATTPAPLSVTAA